MWCIYYDDDTTFDWTQGEPEDAPGLGVVCIVQMCPDLGRQIMAGWDYYFWRPSAEVHWLGTDRFGLIDNLTAKPRDTLAVKAGRTLSNKVYHRIRRNAEMDERFRRSAAAKHEHELPQLNASNSRGKL